MTGEAKEVTAAEISAALDNSGEAAGNAEPPTGDNSNSESQEPNVQETDNTSENQESDEDLENQGAVDKPIEKAEQTDSVPKFDNLEAANKAYLNLHKKLGEQSNELGELRKKAEMTKQLQEEQLQLAKSYGFDSVEDFKNAQIEQEYYQKLAAYEADQYAQHLDKCDFPEEMQKLLMSYRQNPTKETLELIEADFPVEIVKQIAGSMAVAKGQLQAQKQEAQFVQIKETAKAYLDENVNKYAKEFENPAFLALYSEAFKAYGCDLNTDEFVMLMREYASSIEKATTINNGIARENQDVTSEIADLAPHNNAHQPPILNKDIDKMSDKELAASIRKYI